MFRLLVVLLPLLLAVGCTVLAMKMSEEAPKEDLATRLLIGAFALGAVCSVLTWWQQSKMADQVEAARRSVISQADKANWDKAESKGYEDKIHTLTAEVENLRAQLTKQSQGGQPAFASTTASKQGSQSPKLYWTQENIGAGQSAVRFKLYAGVDIPGFAAICDRPCRAIAGQIGDAKEGMQVVGATSNIAGYIFKKPRPVAAGTQGYVIIEPSSADVTQFKVLEDSEIPAGMK
jgi:hypothetical protein